MLSLIGLQIVNKAFYTHTHILADGTIITHAHVYQKNSDKAPIKKHSHSTNELLYYSQLSLFIMIVGLCLGIILQSRVYRYFEFDLPHYYYRLYLIPLHRGPPVA